MIQRDSVVGRVASLWRYPVKSMAGEELSAADVSWHGVAGDRRWAFVRDGQARSGFPWLTLRERPAMSGYRPYFAEPDRPDASVTMVRTPAGDVLDVVDPALAAELAPRARVIKLDRGAFDAFPLSLITTQSIARLGALAGAALEVVRFRPNLVIEASGDQPFAEDTWIGRVLQIGTLRMRIDRRDQRCVIITTDPITTERNPEILRALARERQACIGVYGATAAPGRVAIGDPVVVE